MRGTERSRKAFGRHRRQKSTSRRPPAPTSPPLAGLRPNPADSAMPTQPSAPVPTSPLPSQDQDLVPAPVPPVSPPLSTSTGLRTEVIEASDRTELADTLESRPGIPLKESARILVEPAEPHPLPIAAPIPKVDPMVNQAAMETRRVPTARTRRLSRLRARAVSRRHVVRSGEDFPSIAQDYYGSPRFAKALWWANRTTVAWPQALVAGTRIIIPPVNQLEPSSVKPGANRLATSNPAVEPSASEPGHQANTHQPAG